MPRVAALTLGASPGWQILKIGLIKTKIMEETQDLETLGRAPLVSHHLLQEALGKSFLS
jgi:hypothetical protein